MHESELRMQSYSMMKIGTWIRISEKSQPEKKTDLRSGRARTSRMAGALFTGGGDDPGGGGDGRAAVVMAVVMAVAAGRRSAAAAAAA